jgi:hypothetical protein
MDNLKIEYVDINTLKEYEKMQNYIRKNRLSRLKKAFKSLI